jgi:hypothetical protein
MDATQSPALRRSWAARCVPSRRTAVRMLAGSLATAASGGAFTGPALATHPGLNGKLAYESPIGGGTSIFTLQPFAGLLNSDKRLTSRGSDAIDATWSPDGRQIAFVSNQAGNNEIYAVDNDGRHKRRLTFDTADDLAPSWCQDESIAFTSTRGGSRDIYRMNPDGSAQTRLTTNPAADSDPDCSPQRRQIAFESDRDGNYELYSMSADGDGQTRLTFHPESDRQASWGPKGRRIVFTSRRMGGGSDIFAVRMKRNGRRQHRRGRRQLTHDGRQSLSPAVSPDGESFAFDSGRLIYVGKIDGRQTRTKPVAVGINASWGSLPLLVRSKAPEPLETVNIFPRGDDVQVQLPRFGMEPVEEPVAVPLDSIIYPGTDKVDLQVAVREGVAAGRVRVSRGSATILQEPRDGSAQTKGASAALQTDGLPDTVLELPRLPCKPGDKPERKQLEVDTDPPTATGPASAFRRLTNLEAGALLAGPRTRVRGRYHIAGSRGTKWRVTDTCNSTTTVVLSGEVEIEEPGNTTTVSSSAPPFETPAP